MKKIILTLLMMVAATATMSAQDEPMEQTAAPNIHYVMEGNDYFIMIENSADDPDAIIYYRVAQIVDGEYWYFDEWQEYCGPFMLDMHCSYQIEAYAQVEGKDASDIHLIIIDSTNPAIVLGAFIYADGIDNEKGLKVHICTDPSYGYSFLDGDPVLDGFMYQINHSGEWIQYEKNTSTIYLPEYGDYEITAHGYAIGYGNSVDATAWIHYDAEGYTSYSQPRDDYYQYLVHNGLVYDILSTTELGVAKREYFSGPCFMLPYEGDIVIPSTVNWNGNTYTVVQIGDYAFDLYLMNDTLKVTSVTVPNTITSIKEGAFHSCSALTSIEIPSSVTFIGDYAFEGCSGLTSFVIPNSVTAINRGTFSSCRGLTSIEIPHSITEIGWNAFSWCVALTSIDVPNSVISIGKGVFTGCTSLASMSVESGNTVYDSRNDCNAIVETASNKLIAGCMNSFIPNTVTAIDEEAFYRCSSLTSIDIPNSVTSIGEYAFDGCTGLTDISIPNSITEINKSTFEHCSGLTSVDIPNSVTSIADNAFDCCSGLTSLTIPESVSSIGWYTFHSCFGLTSVICKAETVPATSRDAFYSYTTNVYDQATLFVPNESLAAYKAHEEWSRFSRIVPFIGAGPGDTNGDGEINIADVTGLIDQLLNGEELPDYIDVNGDGEVNISDVTTLIDMLLGLN